MWRKFDVCDFTSLPSVLSILFPEGVGGVEIVKILSRERRIAPNDVPGNCENSGAFRTFGTFRVSRKTQGRHRRHSGLQVSLAVMIVGEARFSLTLLLDLQMSRAD